MEASHTGDEEEERNEEPPAPASQDDSTTEPGDANGVAGDDEYNPRAPQQPGQDDVLCDSCIENPCKALKSCLTCLVSYCEAHLRPHVEKAKFQNHRLVEPLHDIECRTCDVHGLPLELFCVADGRCACRDCECQEHQGHATTSVGEARKRIEVELQMKQQDISQTISDAEKAIDKLQSNSVSIESSVMGVRAAVEQQFGTLQAAVEEAKRGAVEVLHGAQRQALRQAEGIQAHLEQRRAELKKTLSQIEKLSRNKADVDFLQEYSTWKKGVVDVHLPGVCISLMDHLASFSQVVTEATQELRDHILSAYRERLEDVCNSGIQTVVQADTPESQPSFLPEPVTREDFFKYTSRLTFDPDTTHHFLRLTDDNRKVTNTSPWQHSYPDNLARFEFWRQAMTSESLYLGRHYIEAELRGEGAHIGVTYKSIDRKGEQPSSCITGNDFSWCLGRNRKGFSVWHAGVETSLEMTGITKIGLFIDFHKGSIVFYDVSGPMTLLHRYKANFLEPLYVTAWLSKKDNVIAVINEDSTPAGDSTTQAETILLSPTTSEP